jgi:hypothetical protein
MRLATTGFLAAMALAPDAHAEESVPQVRVHVDSEKPVTLYRKPSDGDAWVEACTAPCNKDLPLEDAYRIGEASDEFHLQARAGETVHLAVGKRSPTGYVASTLGLGAGVVGIVIGSVLTVVGAAEAGIECGNVDGRQARAHCQSYKDDGPSLRNLGLVTLGLGVAASVVSLYYRVRSARPEVKKDAYLRTPTWRGEGTSSAFPLFQLKRTF